jgi:hypothetical protein
MFPGKTGTFIEHVDFVDEGEGMGGSGGGGGAREVLIKEALN